MMHVTGMIVLADAPARRVAKNGQTFAPARAVVPAVEPGTVPVELAVIAFGPAAERLLELAPGTMIGVRGRLAAVTWAARDGEQCHGLRVTIEELGRGSTGPTRLEAPRALAGPRAKEPAR